MIVSIVVISILIWYSYITFFQEHHLRTTWEAYGTPEEAGWSSDKLKKAKQYYDSLNSTAVMVIYEGKVLVSWGDVAKNTNAHSIRKSFLSALYGIHIEEGNLQLHRTLEELGIDDNPPLTYLEKQATVADLLTSRSGVFHKAGQETWTMRRNRPNRGSHAAGSYFYYNNWDFNVLGTIFNQETKLDMFQQFKERIAEPIGMEDFTLLNTRYQDELQYSIHPSYLFQISARDMARFGQLYLQKGAWAGRQIIPEAWVKASTSKQAKVPRNEIYQYGLMWWVASEPPFAELGLYSAVGRYGQSIDVIPEKKLVFVHRVDSNSIPTKMFNRSVSQSQRLKLLKLILDAEIKN